MDDLSNQRQAIELLQQLGLKEYEAKSFVALARLSGGTAKEVSDVSEVPRTRVYDAIRVLETKGLVAVRHSNPQVFRAVSIDEATETLRREYESRTERLEEALRDIEPITADGESTITHEVWSLSSSTAITNRSIQLLEDADAEVVLVLGQDAVAPDALLDSLRAAQRRGVVTYIAAPTQVACDRLRETLPETTAFVSDLELLEASPLPDDETTLGRLLLVDRDTILVSSFHEATPDDSREERAVCCRGFDNGLVTLVRRSIARGSVPLEDRDAR